MCITSPLLFSCHFTCDIMDYASKFFLLIRQVNYESCSNRIVLVRGQQRCPVVMITLYDDDKCAYKMRLQRVCSKTLFKLEEWFGT